MHIKNPFNIDKLPPLYFPCLAACLFVCLFCLAPSFMRSFFPPSSFIICLLTDLLIDLFLPSVHLLTTAHACWSVPSRKYFKNARDWCSDTDKNTRELRVTPREEGEKYKVAKRYKTLAASLKNSLIYHVIWKGELSYFILTKCVHDKYHVLVSSAGSRKICCSSWKTARARAYSNSWKTKPIFLKCSKFVISRLSQVPLNPAFPMWDVS